MRFVTDLTDHTNEGTPAFDHGTIVKAAALVQNDPEMGYGFEAYNYDGEVVFVKDMAEAEEVFDKTVEELKKCEPWMETDGECEGMVAIVQTDKGLMVMGVATTSDSVGLIDVRPDATSMPHLCWNRIREDVFGEEIGEDE